VNKTLKTYLVDTLLAWFWSWLILTPFSFYVWHFTLEVWWAWTWTGIPIWLVIGWPYVHLILKTRTRLLKEKPQSL